MEQFKYKLEQRSADKKDKKDEKDELRVYEQHVKLTSDQEKRIVAIAQNELSEIKEQRQSYGPLNINLDDRWDELDRQYAGYLEELESAQFNLSMHTTQVKCDVIVRHICESFIESNPKYAISPRPEYEREDGRQTCEKIEDFLDYELDVNIPFAKPLALVAHSSVRKGTGFLKIPYSIERDKSKQEVTYTGTPEVYTDNNGQPQVKNEGLEEFIERYPDALKKYPGHVKRLVEGKTLQLTEEIEETSYDGPLPQFVDLTNFYARTDIKNYKELSKTRITFERLNFTWRELKQKEENEGWSNVDNLVNKKSDKDDKKDASYQFDDYDIFECVLYFDLNDDDKEEKFIVWISEETNVILNFVRYPYNTVPCYYVPFYIKSTIDGLYDAGIAEDMTDLSVAEDALMCMLLEGTWIRNTITPITKDQGIINQFMTDRFAHGIVLRSEPGKVRFLNEYMGNIDTGGMMLLSGTLERRQEDVSGVPAGKSGKESPLDPHAPASKTIALLQQAGINIKDYLNKMAPSFNEVANIFLQLFYQSPGSEEGRKYKARSVTGSTPFETLSRKDMVAKVNIEVQAINYDMDKLNEKRNVLAIIQLFRQEPLIARNPEAVYYLIKTGISAFGGRWKNGIDKLITPLDEFRKQLVQKSMEAVDQYVRGETAKAEAEGRPVNYDPDQMMMLINDMQSEVATPPDEAVAKQRAEEGEIA